MTDFTYTHVWDNHEEFYSSAVDSFFYNANERYLVIDWDDTLYRYDDVDLDVVRALVDADSVGRAAAEFKQARAAAGKSGTYLGYLYDLDYDEVSEAQASVADVTNNVVDATKEFSLQSVPAVEQEQGGLSTLSSNYTYELFFDIAGSERSHTIKDAKTLEAALTGLNKAAEALGVPVVVKKAVVTFV